MTNMIVSSTLSKITIMMFGIILISAVPFASALFAVGGGSSGSGSGQGDALPPTFTDDSITINQNILVDGDTNEPVVASTGSPVEFVVIASDNLGEYNITHIDIFLNQDGKRILNNLQETYVSFKYGDLKVQNPQELLESATMETIVVGNDKKFIFNVIFNETFDTSNVLIRAWDSYGNISMLYLLDSLKVVSPSQIAESTTEPTADTEPTYTPEPTAESTTTESVSDDIVVASEEDGNNMESVLPFTMMLSDVEDTIPYDISGGMLTSATVNPDNNSVIINIDADNDGTLTISPSTSTQKGIFMVLVDGEESDDAEINGNTVIVPFNAGTEQIEIIGTFVIPEFGTIAAMILAVAIISIIAISSKSRLSIVPRY